MSKQELWHDDGNGIGRMIVLWRFRGVISDYLLPYLERVGESEVVKFCFLGTARF